jgi:CheY-like chemotaxis protein
MSKREKPLVLLLDDEEIFLEIAAVKLHASGLETVMANDVRDALAKAESLLPDLVLSDIYMPPGPTGWEFALELRRNPKTRDVKIAFFTSLRDPWIELKTDRKTIAAELGPVVFLSKIDDVDALADRVGKLIKASG